MTDLVKDGTDASFVQDVIEPSKEALVLVDFWAPWCGPCRTLGPAIERVVKGFNGKVKLVKINVDQNPHFSGQLRVQSIPAVFAFKDGQPIDGFMGALPESQVKAFVEKHISGSAEDGAIGDMLESAQESLSLGDIGGAAQSYATILQVDAKNVKALAGLARCYMKGGELDKAQALMDEIPEAEKDADVVTLRALMALANDANDAREPHEIKAEIGKSGDDLALNYELAQAFIKEGEFDEAIEAIFKIMQKDLDWNEKKARHLLLKIFDALGPASEITKSGRRRLSTLLFS